MPGESDNLFLEEVLGLFALEAQEWVEQAGQALTELEAGCAADRVVKLYDIIIRGLSNLAGSAATVERQEVEQLALGLLPLLQDLRQQAVPPPRAAHAAIHDRLMQILAAVQHRQAGDGASPPVAVDDVVPPVLGAEVEPAPPPVQDRPPADDPAQAPGEGAVIEADEISSPEARHEDNGHPADQSQQLRAALLQLLAAQSGSPEGTRHSAEVVLRKAQGDSDGLEEAAVLRALREIELLDEQFLVEVHKRAPVITQTCSSLLQPDAPQASPERTRLFHEIEHLYEISRFVNSTPIMLYLQGLRTFLRIAADRPALVPAARYEAVRARVAMLEALAQRWVEIGREERASIQKILVLS